MALGDEQLELLYKSGGWYQYKIGECQFYISIPFEKLPLTVRKHYFKEARIFNARQRLNS